MTTPCHRHKRYLATVAKSPVSVTSSVIPGTIYSSPDFSTSRAREILIMPRRKGSKKKVASTKASNPAKYVVSPVSPANTRSKSVKPLDTDLMDGNVVAPEEPTAATPPPPSPLKKTKSSRSSATDMQDLEDRWDLRLSRMETAIRTGLSQQSCSAGSSTGIGQESTVSPAPVAPPAAAVVASGSKSSRSKSSRKGKKKSRARTPSPALSSDSEGSGVDSDSSDSSASSESESDSDTKTKKKKKGKYNAAKYLDEGDKIDSFERLMLGNLRMAAKLLKKERDIQGLLQHLILIAEKAQSGTFGNDCLCKYDEAVRSAARKDYAHLPRLILQLSLDS